MRKLYRKLVRKNVNSHSGRMFSDRKWIIPFLASLLVSVTLFVSAIFWLYNAPNGGDELSFDIISFARAEESTGYFVESDLKKSINTSGYSNMEPARLAYLISGTKGDSNRMTKTLQAVYHPRNQYVRHLDLEAPPRERLEFSNMAKNDPTFREVENVLVMSQSNLVTYKGPTMIACTLQAIAILLKESLEWDWFLNLSASDYPLVTQDDLQHVFSILSRDLNFIEHTQIAGWEAIRTSAFTCLRSLTLLGPLNADHCPHLSSCIQFLEPLADCFLVATLIYVTDCVILKSRMLFYSHGPIRMVVFRLLISQP
ncbi:beta-glucuronosyltransferase GlcAT14B-like [Hibiscus syriacus]|uniref:beta-glucuronosyltransferase GlcAT14B-like n=1 Tax=Hibiscus syriacus TaxID=106335 RepID=UPI0019213C0F|nr:beta-glucuronosyltransferase GlcAT14B-like [Hibiscus syriacus]